MWYYCVDHLRNLVKKYTKVAFIPPVNIIIYNYDSDIVYQNYRRIIMEAKITYWVSFFLVVTGIVFAQGVDPGTENLTHSWLFNDATANDYVGGANGTLMGNAEVWDGVLFLGELDCWMEMPADVIALNTYEEVTIEAWFMSFAESNTEYHMLAYFGDTLNGVGCDGYFITPARGDDSSRAAISCGVYENPWSGETGVNGPEYDDGELHHFVSTLDDSVITLYIDGELTASAPLDSGNSIANISPACAYLAKGGYSADPTWQGQIYEFNIYNKALTAEEILFLSAKDPTVAIDKDETVGLAREFGLLRIFPNPFNPVASIAFDLAERSNVEISVYDLQGHRVARLLNETRVAGHYKVLFDGTKLCSGLYLCKMDIDNNQVFTRKMLLLK